MPQTFKENSYTKFGTVADTTLFKQFREDITDKMDSAFPAIAKDLTDIYDNLGNIETPNMPDDAEDQTVAFSEASGNPVNIVTGETIKILFGKIAKWFNSFGALAWKSKIAAEDIEDIDEFKQGLEYTPGDVGAMPATTSKSGTYTELKLVNNTEYDYANISSLDIELDDVSAHGFVEFGTISSAPKYINSEDVLKAYRFDGDDITTAANNELWEFDILNKSIIWKNWGVLSE